jgi:glycosyltransferase involved in cell wall biosynthesis
MNGAPRKVFILNPLKDVVHLGLTTHALNVFPPLPGEDFVSYGFSNNSSFESGSLRRLPWRRGLPGVFDEVAWMRKLRPDILYGTGNITESFIVLFRPRSAKYVIAWHGPYDKKWLLDVGNHSFRAHVAYWIATHLLAHSDLIACDTEFIARSLRGSFPNKKVVVTLNGVDTVFYDPAKRDPRWLSEKLSIPAGSPVFVFVGHLIKRKRPEIFVELARRMPHATFVMVGREGLYHASDVEAWQKTAPNLQWIPSSLTREEMPRLLASATALVFPSLQEPFGLAIVEAMASGLPVVATRSGSPAELIDDGKEGFLIDEGGDEIDHYGRTLVAIIKDGPEIEKIKHAARIKTEKIFNWPDVSRRYEDAFRELF